MQMTRRLLGWRTLVGEKQSDVIWESPADLGAQAGVWTRQ